MSHLENSHFVLARVMALPRRASEKKEASSLITHIPAPLPWAALVCLASSYRKPKVGPPLRQAGREAVDEGVPFHARRRTRACRVA